jgi:hypothetical protein
VPNDLNGFHVQQAIKWFHRWIIIDSHQVKLPGDDEELDTYYHLASITDAEMPSTQ